MDPDDYQPGFQYGYTHFLDPSPSAPSTATTNTMHQPSTKSDTESSFNDSGYTSSPQRSHFTSLSSHLRGSNPAHLGGPPNQGHSPSKSHGSVVADLMGAPRPSWQEDFPNVNDEWDHNFINNFEENLFGFDAADLNTMVDGILATPFTSPRQTRSAAAGLGLSPFKSMSTANVMLAPRRSPARLGGSPFKSPFSSPSPVKGLNTHSRTSPMTRQRRLILQSPVNTHNKPQHHSLTSNLHDFPDFLADVKQEQCDDLGVVPFQRTNSLGFSPQEDLSSSPPFSSLFSDNAVLQPQTLEEINNHTPVRHGKRVKTEGMYGLRSSPPGSVGAVLFSLNGGSSSSPNYHLRSSPLQQNENYHLRSSPLQQNENYQLRSSPSQQNEHLSYNLRSSPPQKYSYGSPSSSSSSARSPARLAQGRISVTRHTQLISQLPPKDALRLVRARFREVLDKATAEAVVKEQTFNTRVKPRSSSKKPGQYPEISQALSRSVTDADTLAGCGQTQVPAAYKPAGKRRQNILPKPTPDWPRREPCKIAPKKRKR